jgi:Putative zinc- or iron-chelating domain
MKSDTRISLLEHLYALYDAFAGDLHPACRKGCAACCTRNVTLTSLEGRVIHRHLGTMGHPHWQTALRDAASQPHFQPRVTLNQLAELCARDQVIPEEVIDPHCGPCPLLIDNTCCIYAARPFGCRAMVSTRVCTANGEARMPDFVLTVNNVFLQYIEAIDHEGFSGNLIDVVLHLTSDCSGFVDIRHLGRHAQHLLPNRGIPVLMIPPEHRQHMQRHLQDIQSTIRRFE